MSKEQLKSKEVQSNAYELVNKQNQFIAARSKVEHLVKNPDWRKLASDKTAVEYEYFLKAQGSSISISSGPVSDRARGAKKLDDPKHLEMTYSFMSQQWRRAEKRLHKVQHEIDKAIDQKYGSKVDKNFLIENLILTGTINFGADEQAQELEKVIKNKIKRMKEDRQSFDDISNNKLANEGYLQVSKDNKFKLIDEKAYLNLSVPERRKYLKEAQKALKEAIIYSGIQEGIELPKLKKEYLVELKKIKDDEKIIGMTTFNKCAEALEKLKKPEEIKYWIEMMRDKKDFKEHRDLWKNIRSELPPHSNALNKMDSARDKMGYTDLFKLYGEIKNIECKRLNDAYKAKLQTARNAQIISESTMEEFMKDEDGMEKQDLKGKYKYMAGLSQQLARYNRLRSDINQLDKGKQEQLNKLYKQPKMGFTEIRDAYRKIKDEKGAVVVTPNESESGLKLLNSITNPVVRDGISDSLKKIRAQGKEKQERFLQLLKDMTQGISPNEYDNRSYQNELLNLSHPKNKALSNEVSSQSNKISIESVGNKANNLQQKLMKKRQLNEKNKPQELDKASFAKQNKGVLDFQARLRKRKQADQTSTDHNGQNNKKSAWFARLGFKKQSIDESNQVNQVGTDDSLIEHQTPDSIQKPKNQTTEIKETHDNRIDQKVIQKHMKELDKAHDLKAFQEDGFSCIESVNENGQVQRLAMVTMNWEKSLDQMYIADNNAKFQGKDCGGEDAMMFGVRNHAGENIALNFREVKIMEKLLQEELA